MINGATQPLTQAVSPAPQALIQPATARRAASGGIVTAGVWAKTTAAKRSGSANFILYNKFVWVVVDSTINCASKRL